MDETIGRRAALRSIDDAPEPQRPNVAFEGFNAYAADPTLAAALDASLDEATEDALNERGAYFGSAEAQNVARLATATAPTFRPEDYDGRRIDQIDLHPATHALTNRSVAAGLLSSAWEDGEGTNQHRLRAANLFLTAGLERAHLLPICHTHASVAALAYAPDLEAELFPLIAARQYDRRPAPTGHKTGAMIALALSEREREGERGAVRTRGELSAGESARVTGEKVFVPAPFADYLLTLVRTADGTSAVAVPRHAEENAAAIRIDGFSNTTGLSAQAITTVRFENARGKIIGEPGRGLQVMRDVRTLTQLDAAIVSAGTLRGALARCAHILRTRTVAGRPLLNDPSFARVLADLALTSAGLTALSLRLAGAFDRAFERDGDHAVARILTPAARLFCARAGAAAALEIRECAGVPALSADHPLARAVADLGLLPLFDPGGDPAADLSALLARDQNVLVDALDELGTDLGTQNHDLVERTMTVGREAASDPGLTRAFVDQFAMVAAASAMRRNLPRVVSDAFIASRLRGGYTTHAGTLDSRFDPTALIDFIVPDD